MPGRGALVAILGAVSLFAAGCAEAHHGFIVVGSPAVQGAGFAATAPAAAPNATAFAPGASGPAATLPTDTPAPSDAQPSAVATGAVTQQVLKVWPDILGTVNYEVAIEVTNTGSRPLGIGASLATEGYTIVSTSGSTLTSGVFTYAFPPVLAAGQKGYLVDGGVLDAGVKATSVGKLVASVAYADSTTPTELMTASDVHVARESLQNGLQASASVTNTTGREANGLAGFIFFDGKGAILAAVYDNLLQHFPAGATWPVSTSYPGTGPIDPAAVKRTVVVAYDVDAPQQ